MRSQPREPRDLAIAANNAWCIAFDNLSSVPDWLSDGLCRLSTGGGFATRTLYSDSDETILDATRPILLNGIDSVATRGDLLDRAILLTLPRLQNVKPERDFWRDFDSARPRILGALARRGGNGDPARRRDHARGSGTHGRRSAVGGCCGAGAALGDGPLYRRVRGQPGRREHHRARVIARGRPSSRTFLAGRLSWEGTATELLCSLDEQAGDR